MRIDHVAGDKNKIGFQPGDRPRQTPVLPPELLPVQITDVDNPQAFMASVSYTHLDAYKRQPWTCSSIFDIYTFGEFAPILILISD